jgi:outer membrane protein insertion porin family
MKSSKRFLFLLIWMLLPTLAHGQLLESMRIAKIDVIVESSSPHTAFNPNTVRTRMHTKVGNFFSQAEFDNDLKMLAEEYDRLEPSLVVVNNEIYITLQIWLKPTIRDIIFCGNECFSTKKLNKTLEIEKGTLFDRESFIKAFNKIRLMYVKKGYFEAELDYEVVPLEDNEVDIQIHIHEGRAGKIKELCFSGLTSGEEDDLLETILTKKYNLLLSWWTGKGIYHPEMIEHDRLQMINYFQNKGYADAVVTISIEEAACDDRIMLMIGVDKGIRYSVGNLTLCGNTLFDNQRIWDQFIFGIGSVYSPEDIRCTLQAINDLYGSCGYIDINVDFQLALREDCPVYDIAISIDEGERYYVGLIKVFGNCYTQNNVILHECLLCPGEVFDNRKLEGTEERLCNTGYFGVVNVYAVRSQIVDPSGQRNYRDVYIEIEETDTGNLGLFFGFSSLDKVFGGVEISERNFNIAGIPHVVQRGPGVLRGGGEFALAKINIGNRQTSYSTQWTKPYFLDTPWILGVDLEKSDNRALSRAYSITTYGGNVHATYIINPYLKYDLYYRARHTHVSVSTKKNPELKQEGNISGFISALGNALIYDSTDHPRRASYGFRSRLLYELAGIGGNFQFMKFAYLNAYYYPLSEDGTLKFRAELQFIKTYGHTTPIKLPLSERFYLGGETTVRGYRPFIIGPKFDNNEPRGGVSSLLLSEEYQYNLLAAPCLDGFVFVDAGYVSLSEFTLGQFAASVGFGIRIEVMRNMPIMMGLGWPIHPGEKSRGRELNNTQRFFFAMGGTF